MTSRKSVIFLRDNTSLPPRGPSEVCEGIPDADLPPRGPSKESECRSRVGSATTLMSSGTALEDESPNGVRES